MIALPKALGSSETAPMAAGAAEATASTGADGSQTSYQSGSQEAHTLGIGAMMEATVPGSFSEGNTRSGNSHSADAGQSEGTEVQGETVADSGLAGYLTLSDTYQGSSDEQNGDSGNDQCENRHK